MSKTLQQVLRYKWAGFRLTEFNYKWSDNNLFRKTVLWLFKIAVFKRSVPFYMGTTWIETGFFTFNFV